MEFIYIWQNNYIWWKIHLFILMHDHPILDVYQNICNVYFIYMKLNKIFLWKNGKLIKYIYCTYYSLEEILLKIWAIVYEMYVSHLVFWLIVRPNIMWFRVFRSTGFGKQIQRPQCKNWGLKLRGALGTGVVIPKPGISISVPDGQGWGRQDTGPFIFKEWVHVHPVCGGMFLGAEWEPSKQRWVRHWRPHLCGWREGGWSEWEWMRFFLCGWWPYPVGH